MRLVLACAVDRYSKHMHGSLVFVEALFSFACWPLGMPREISIHTHHVCMHARTHAHTHTDIRTHTHTHVYPQTHVHTPNTRTQTHTFSGCVHGKGTCESRPQLCRLLGLPLKTDKHIHLPKHMQSRNHTAPGGFCELVLLSCPPTILTVLTVPFAACAAVCSYACSARVWQSCARYAARSW